MNSEDQGKFKELITVISDTYKKEFTPSELKLWWNIFKQHSISDFESAVYSHISCADEGVFCPKPANLIKHITGTAKENERAIADSSSLAWAVIIRELENTGPYKSLEIEDKKALAAVSSLGGWAYLCSKTYEELGWIEKRFKELYDVYERTNDEDLPKQLQGLAGEQTLLLDGDSEVKELGGIIKQLKQKTEVLR